MTSSRKIVFSSRYDIHGGIKPNEHKSLSSESPIQTLPPSESLILPLANNHSKSNNLFKIGDYVFQNQPLIESSISEFTTLSHSGNDGRIVEMTNFDFGHTSGLPTPAVKIKREAKDNNNNKSTNKQLEILDWKQASEQQIISRVHQSGIVGLGGAAFPTHIKLQPPKNSIKTLIVNAMECEPYITCDDRLLQECSDDILRGALITAKAIGAKKILFGIEDNKPKAIESLTQVIQEFLLTSNDDKTDDLVVNIIVAKTKYPSGGEKQIIELLTGKQVPKDERPSSIGILVQNVATLFAINDAVTNGQVMTRRLVTITGNLVPKPGNYWISFGTPIQHIIESLGVVKEALSKVIFGGPLMGQSIQNFAVPTKKSTNCIIFNASESEQKIQPQACIRCGECELACPIQLVPQQLYWFAKNQQWESLEEQNLADCIECGACSYVCPSEIPLVSYYQYAKSEIKHLTTKQQQSEQAKSRYENRIARLDRIKQEREAKRKKTAEARKMAAKNKQSDPDGKQSAIEAALQRVQSKKENQ